MKNLIDKIKLYISKPVFWITFVVLITSAVFIPALKMEFWWVDDGWDIMMTQKITNSIIHLEPSGLGIIFNEPGGRFRIVYWFYQTLEYWIGGLNPTLHFLVHYLVILISVLLIFQIVHKLSKSNVASFIASILYVLSPINTENIFRLGPQEPLLGLLMLTSLYFLINKKILTSVLFLLLATLSKENGFILWIPIFLFYLGKLVLFKKRDRSLGKYCLWGIIFSIPPILNILLRRGGYSGFYTFSINHIITNFKSYISLVNTAFSPFFVVLSAAYIVRIVIFFKFDRFKKSRSNLLTQLIFFILFIMFVLVQSPWEFVLNRYMMPATVGLVLFLGMEIAGILETLKALKFKFMSPFLIIFGIYIITFIWVNMAHTYLSGQLSAHETRFIKSLNQNLASEVPYNGVVLLNFLNGDSTMELVDEIKIHLRLFYSRPDIKVSYLDLGNLPKGEYIIVGTGKVRPEYPRETIEKNIAHYWVDESINKEDKFIILTTPVNLFKQVAKKTYNYILHKIPIDNDGIFAYYVSHDSWYKYYVE